MFFTNRDEYESEDEEPRYWLLSVARILFPLSLIFTTSYFAWGKISDPEEFPLRSVLVEGTYNHLKQETLQQVTMSSLQGSFFTLNISEVQESLLQIPWIETVNVTRHWPDKLVIQFTEQTAVARWNLDSLVNTKGKVFTPSHETISADLPLLNGAAGQEETVFKMYNEIETTILPLKLKLSQLDLSARGAWTATLDNGTTLYLGRDNVQGRIKRLVGTYTRVIGSKGNKVDYIDLRYPSGLSVHWKKKI